MKQTNIKLIRFLTILIMLSILAVGSVGPALAQGGGGDAVASAFSSVIENIMGIVKRLTLYVGGLGLGLWGFGKVIRPVDTTLSQYTQQYLKEFVIGIVIVYGASTIVEALVTSIEGSF